MKITDVKIIEKNDNIEDGYYEVISVYQDKEKEDRQAISINPNVSSHILLLCASRLNQIIARMLGMPYDDYLKHMKEAYYFTKKYENLNLTEEQIMKMVEKELRGF